MNSEGEVGRVTVSVQGLVDYHTQTLEHGAGKSRRVRETVQAAINAGLKTICLTDHYPLPPGFTDPTPDKDCAMPAVEYPTYLQEVDAAIASAGGQINVRRGAEVDWLPEYQAWTASEIAQYSFDYVLGSVHFLGEIEEDGARRSLIIDFDINHLRAGADYYGGVQALVEKYYAEVRAMVESGLFDGVGHLDLVKKFNTGHLFDQSDGWYRRAVLETLDCIAASGMSMEINGAGLEKACKELYPSAWIVEEARGRGIPLTVGSDAHKPEDIGKNLGVAVQSAKSAGYEEVVEYVARQQTVMRLQT